MISLKKSLDMLDQVREHEDRAKQAAQGYRDLVTVLTNSLAALGAEHAAAFEAKIANILTVAERGTSAPAHSGDLPTAEIGKEVGAFCRTVANHYQQREHELKAIIKIVGEASAKVASNGVARAKELREMTSRVESISRLESIIQIRNQLSRAVGALGSMAKNIEQDGQSQASAMSERIREFEERIRRVEEIATTDALTNVGNRRRAEDAVGNAIAAKKPFSLIFFDLDRFKSVNDTYGHKQGDKLLQCVAAGLKDSVRRQDIVCRWGGDEFLIVLPESSLAEARKVQLAIQKHTFGDFLMEIGGRSIRLEVHASFGLVQHQPDESASEIFERVDREMYAAKAAARARAERTAALLA